MRRSRDAATAAVRAAGLAAGLIFLWLLFAATLTTSEFVAGILGAGIAAAATGVVVRQEAFRFAPRARWARRLWRLPWQVIRDFGQVTGALWLRLLGRRRSTGVFRAVPFPGGRTGRASARRAVAAAAGSLAPNTYVVGFDVEEGLMLVHELMPGPPSRTADLVRPR